MRRAAFAALALAAMAGCAPMQWARPGSTPAELDADLKQCQQQAWQETNERYIAAHGFSPWLNRDAFGSPFTFGTVGPFFDPYHDRRLEEGRLANFCMRVKGYDLQPAAPAKP
jgi:hypothetical protein